jgi:hypothetical protein
MDLGTKTGKTTAERTGLNNTLIRRSSYICASLFNLPSIKKDKITKNFESETTKLWRQVSLQKDHNKEKCMKRITSILAVMALSSAAYAADTVDMKWNAEMRTRYTSDNAYAGVKGDKSHSPNTYNAFDQRNKLGLGLSKGESFQGKLTLINNFAWGNTNDRTTTTDNPGTAAVTGGNLLLINEAYGWWKANDMTSLKFGRSAFEIAGGYVSSADDWLANPYTWDGIWSMWDFEPISLNVFGTKAKDTNVAHAQIGTAHAGQSDAESVMYGAIVGFKTLPDALKKAEIHLLQQNDEVTVPALAGTPSFNDSFRTELMRYGLFVNGDVAGFNYHAAADMYQGKFKYFSSGSSTDIDMTGSMFDVGVGYTMPEMMMMHFGLTYHMDSGGDTATAANKSDKTYHAGQYDAHNIGGTLLDAVAWGNLTYFRLNFGMKPQEDLGVDLYLSKFSRTNNKDTVMVYGTAAGTVAATDSSDIGQEIDLTLTKSYGDNFSIWALYGMFQPGDMVKKDGVNGTVGSTEEEQHTRIQVQGKLTF